MFVYSWYVIVGCWYITLLCTPGHTSAGCLGTHTHTFSLKSSLDFKPRCADFHALWFPFITPQLSMLHFIDLINPVKPLCYVPDGEQNKEPVLSNTIDVPKRAKHQSHKISIYCRITLECLSFLAQSSLTQLSNFHSFSVLNVSLLFSEIYFYCNFLFLLAPDFRSPMHLIFI